MCITTLNDTQMCMSCSLRFLRCKVHPINSNNKNALYLNTSRQRNVIIFPFFDHLCIVSFLPDGERIRKQVEKQSLRRNNKLDLEEWRRAKDIAEGITVFFQS